MQLKEANESLSAKSDEVAALEAKVSELQASLSGALADAKAKTSSFEQLQTAKKASEAELAVLKASLQQVRDEHARDRVSLDSVLLEVRFYPLPGVFGVDETFIARGREEVNRESD